MHYWCLIGAEIMLICTTEQGWIIFSLLVVTDSPKKKKRKKISLLYTVNSGERAVGVFLLLLFCVLFLDITKMFHPLYFEIKNGEHYLYLNHILQQMKILNV